MKSGYYLISLSMRERGEIKIKYRSGIQHKGTINGSDYLEPVYDYVSASKSCVKRYNTALMILAGIGGCERLLMDWISHNMTEGNYITNNDLTRRNFIEFHKKYKNPKNKEYSENTVRLSFQKLASAGFLIPMTRGTFLVNPMMYFASDDEERIRAIKMMMEFKSGYETKITLDIKKQK